MNKVIDNYSLMIDRRNTVYDCLRSSINRFFMASFSAFSFKMKSLTTSSKARSAFTLIWALPARRPDDNSVLGSNCLLKFPSLIMMLINSG